MRVFLYLRVCGCVEPHGDGDPQYGGARPDGHDGPDDPGVVVGLLLLAVLHGTGDCLVSTAKKKKSAFLS